MAYVRRGVALSGLEFNGDFQALTDDTVAYFAAKGLDFVRISFLWDEVQPNIFDPLNTTALGYIDEILGFCSDHNILAILDMHNYARRFIYADGGFVDDFSNDTQHVIR